MKYGDLIGIGFGTEVALYVSVEQVKPDGFTGFVINGAWTFFMEFGTNVMTIHAPSGDHKETGLRVIYTGLIPEKVRKQGYNEVITYMEEQLKSSTLRRLWSRLCIGLDMSRVTRAIASSRLVRSLAAAKTSFMCIWSGTSNRHLDKKHVYTDDELNDEVPF